MFLLKEKFRLNFKKHKKNFCLIGFESQIFLREKVVSYFQCLLISKSSRIIEHLNGLGEE